MITSSSFSQNAQQISGILQKHSGEEQLYLERERRVGERMRERGEWERGEREESGREERERKERERRDD